ncbi:MAG: hypothetical protein K6C99_00335 [Lachnospiraceae bacterium]|nr:hypothetical protein [Lachnospiraceae bacterium]
MVELFEKNIIETATRSSKGNQLKWRNGDTWYKADYTGYEGLAEYVISHLIAKSSMNEGEYLLYDLEKISYKSTVYNGVRSRNFLSDDWQLITLERLFKSVYGRSLNSMIYKTADKRSRLKLLVDETERVTGIRNFGIYMAKMITIDSFFLNEDRHTHNIAVLVNGAGQYKTCPYFDQGAGLLSDTTMDYPLGGDIYRLIDSVKPKTFCEDFFEQLEIAEDLYGYSIRFDFSKKDVDVLLYAVPDDMYSQEIIERVRTICYERIRQMEYLFGKNLRVPGGV